MMKEKKTFQHVTSKEICQTYELLRGKNLVPFPITEQAIKKLDSLASSIGATHFGTEIYPTTKEKAFAYFYFLIKNHPFTDGNKRTASLVFTSLCELNDLDLGHSVHTLEVLAVFIGKIKEPEHQAAIRALSRLVFS